MKFIKTLLALFVFFIIPSSFAQTIGKAQGAVYFESAKFDLNDTAKMNLKALADTLKLKQKLQISVSGNTDDVGDSVFNLRLSENRSREVRRFLIANGIDSVKIKIGYNGENKPLADNESETGKQKNRRVDIAAKWETPKPPEPQGDIRELQAMLVNEISTYNISLNRDTVLYSERGTRLVILANAFGDQKACKEETITIEYKDALNQADMVLDNLATTSNGQLLESGGMAYINAKCGKKMLRIKGTNSVFLVFPTDTIRNNMKVFSGQRNAETDPMNWNLAKKDNVWTNCSQFQKAMYDKLLADALKNQKKGCLGGGKSKKKLEDKIKKRIDELQVQMNNEDAPEVLCAPFNRALFGGEGDGDQFHAKMKKDVADSVFGSEGEAMQYIVSVSKLGWVNCGKFVSQNPVDYIVNSPANNTTTSFMALRSSRSLINGFPKDKKFLFPVPAGLAYKFVGIKYEDKKAYLATMEGNTNDPANTVTYKYFENIADLKEAIKNYFSK